MEEWLIGEARVEIEAATPPHNPARGGFNWYSVEGADDGEFSGWFVIDHIVYDGTTIDELDLRFERLCEYRPHMVPSHGQFHFVRE